MFLITYDCSENRAMVEGNAILDGKVLPRQLMPHKFDLYDDDGELMFSGVSSDRDSLEAFDPLDHAQDRYGCTEIRYLQDDDTWEVL